MAKKKAAAKAAPALFPNDTPETKTPKDSVIVREILNSGILKPAEIVTVAKEKYGKDITTGNINQIKRKWKAEQAAKPAAPKAAVPAAAPVAPVAANQTAAAPTIATAAAAADPITATMNLVKAVGLDQAQAILNSLRSPYPVQFPSPGSYLNPPPAGDPTAMYR